MGTEVSETVNVTNANIGAGYLLVPPRAHLSHRRSRYLAARSTSGGMADSCGPASGVARPALAVRIYCKLRRVSAAPEGGGRTSPDVHRW